MPFKDPLKEKEYKRIKHLQNREANLIKMRAYYAANREKILSQNKKWMEDNKERMRLWRKANREELRIKALAWRHANPDKIRKIKERWNSANMDSVRASQQRTRDKKSAAKKKEEWIYRLAWQRANKDKTKKYRRAYYLKMKSADPDYIFSIGSKRRKYIKDQGTKTSRGLTKKLLTSQGGLCAMCKCDLSASKFHRDHIIPISKGGLHCDENVQLLCPPCNLSKGNRILQTLTPISENSPIANQ